jgi:hypothetical protein
VRPDFIALVRSERRRASAGQAPEHPPVPPQVLAPYASIEAGLWDIERPGSATDAPLPRCRDCVWLQKRLHVMAWSPPGLLTTLWVSSLHELQLLDSARRRRRLGPVMPHSRATLQA